MRFVARSVAAVGTLATLAGFVAAQNNQIELHNPAEVVFYIQNNDPAMGPIVPSVGGPIGAPMFGNNDALAMALPAEQVNSLGGTVTLDTLGYVFIGDSDWPSNGAGGPPVWDFVVGPSTPISGVGTVSTHLPDHLGAAPGAGDTLVSVGASGLPNPCAMSPATCTPPTMTGCPPPISGFNVDVSGFGALALPGDTGFGPTSGIGGSVTGYYPGGMTLSGGACGLGNFEWSGAHSTNENQADAAPVASGLSYANTIAIGDPAAISPAIGIFFNNVGDERHFGLTQGISQAVVENTGGAPFPAELGTAGMLLDVTVGGARLGVNVRDTASAGLFAISGAAPSFFPVAGGVPCPAGGAVFANIGHPIFTTTATSPGWIGPLDAMGERSTPTLPVPASAAGLTLYLQTLTIVSLGPIVLRCTTTWCVRLF